jgi:cell division protein FtsW
LLNVHRNSVFLLVLAVIGLIGLGLVMLSSTAGYARESGGNAATLLQKQVVWLIIGATFCVAASIMDYARWRQTWWLWFALAAVLLTLCYIPPIGHEVNGSSRWLKIGGVSLQPSELGKLALVIALAWWFSAPRREGGEASEPPREHTFTKGFAVPLLGAGVLIALIACEVDMGTTALLGATTFVLMFVAGVRWRYLLPVALLGVAGLAALLMRSDEHRGRLFAFLWPDQYPADWYQQEQGLIALGSGGLGGLGLGFGRQKMSFLPFAHTDFILPVVGEELGVIATLLVVLSFVVILLSGSVIAIRARDRFGMLLGFGIVLLLAMQAAINIGVTTGVMPNKGMPLPFISYGGSNLVFCLVCIGILISIWRRGIGEKEEKANVRLAANVRRRPARI